jgi:hypothetical protein
MMNNEIIHTAICAGRMFALAASVLCVRLATVYNLQSRTKASRHNQLSDSLRTK